MTSTIGIVIYCSLKNNTDWNNMSFWISREKQCLPTELSHSHEFVIIMHETHHVNTKWAQLAPLSIQYQASVSEELFHLALARYQPTWQGFSGLVHEEIHPCGLTQSTFETVQASCINSILVTVQLSSYLTLKISWPWNLGQGSLTVIGSATIRRLVYGFLFAFHNIWPYLVPLLR